MGRKSFTVCRINYGLALKIFVLFFLVPDLLGVFLLYTSCVLELCPLRF
jgi:hypothetical protein